MQPRPWAGRMNRTLVRSRLMYTTRELEADRETNVLSRLLPSPRAGAWLGCALNARRLGLSEQCWICN